MTSPTFSPAELMVIDAALTDRIAGYQGRASVFMQRGDADNAGLQSQGAGTCQRLQRRIRDLLSNPAKD